jgi:hypothetical protein
VPRRPFDLTTLLTLSLLATGCGPDPNDQPFGRPAPAPQDSGMDRPVVKGVDSREVGHGFPDRLHAGLARAARGEVEVWVESASGGGRLIVSVFVRTRGGKAVPFDGWADPAAVTIRDPDGRTSPLIPWTAAQKQADREWEVGHPEHGFGMGAGAVTRDRPRLTAFQFDVAAPGVEHFDLDLGGAAVGFTDPILFRIPGRMIVPPGIAAAAGKHGGL